MFETDLKIQLQTLPTSPGIYQYFDKEDQLLYIGKAKNLKKRVLSYFTKTHDNAKTRILVKKIAHIKHIVVETETDALILENNLIKKYQPKYNIMLKDDKTYPWLCIKNEAFPRVFLTRRIIKDGSEYFGPYTSVKTVIVLLGLIKELFMLRTCNFDLSPINIAKKKYSVCLDYHIGNCKGPCEGLQLAADYNDDINAIRNILKGHFKASLKKFEDLMQRYAADLKFEEAQKIKEKIEILANYQAKSTVVHPSITNVDVFSILSDDEFAYVNFLKINNGAIIQSHTAEIKKKLNETDKELLTLSIIEIRQRFQSQSTEIYVPIKVNVGEAIKVTIPLQGDKKRIVELSLRNARYYRQERFKQIKIIDPERHTKRILGQMKADLHLQVEPQHIECFDNSNIQGTNPVAACVVFKNAKPSKKDYRHFNIKTVEGPDDFASMEEVVYRRYKRLLDEGASLPQLIVIDGGKGQLSSALKSLEALNLRGKIAIIGIAKRLEELYYPDDSVPLYLDKRSETLKIIQQLRDEAHRFGITHHRDKRSKQALNSDLTQIFGVGEKSAEVLLKHYKSLKRIKEADLEDLMRVAGNVLGKKVYEFYKKNN
ncbi:MAG: excinuclease ABC subunit C [Flavobacteriales bacterium CG_4_9_14_0_2_um_filter_35_242]|nr:excinuclease ABC subunit UvrC [Zetaproteobacteria bacterium]OIO09941.1 MAG: excinuclease ABC subunit C [Flavobacteriaceae bacterium CG1_02_35_72]PIV15999.1 MAG: excinuclease ABC subunit C [Flavobacteriales bacterium CG03_land_8_20_14_0_80_35_15]PJC59687.1 MAG: excinuclease ABC subunit C [Flavobacteriales bacterium CG_4_9_14_0_2_um_filter_35_242]